MYAKYWKHITKGEYELLPYDIINLKFFIL